MSRLTVMRVQLLRRLGGNRQYSLSVSSKPRVQDDDEFRVLDFTSKRGERFQRKEFKRAPVAPPRALQMSVEQKWSDVWPGPRSFHPAVVPLPLRQGFTPLGVPAPPAPANAELMKIPNFLHLTPPAVAAQCAQLKRFCSAWPDRLTEERCEELFPLETITADYCHSSPSIRDPLSRIVSVRVKLSKLPLDAHAKDKLRRLVGERYDENTDLLTIVTDRCPTRKQNLDYANYLMTAVFHEAWNVEPWEAKKREEDMEVYIWDKNMSKVSLYNYAHFGQSNAKLDDELLSNFDVEKVSGGSFYKEAVSELLNEGENEYQLNKYKNAVKALLGLNDANDLKVDDANKEN